MTKPSAESGRRVGGGQAVGEGVEHPQARHRAGGVIGRHAIGAGETLGEWRRGVGRFQNGAPQRKQQRAEQGGAKPGGGAQKVHRARRRGQSLGGQQQRHEHRAEHGAFACAGAPVDGQARRDRGRPMQDIAHHRGDQIDLGPQPGLRRGGGERSQQDVERLHQLRDEGGRAELRHDRRDRRAKGRGEQQPMELQVARRTAAHGEASAEHNQLVHRKQGEPAQHCQRDRRRKRRHRRRMVEQGRAQRQQQIENHGRDQQRERAGKAGAPSRLHQPLERGGKVERDGEAGADRSHAEQIDKSLRRGPQLHLGGAGEAKGEQDCAVERQIAQAIALTGDGDRESLERQRADRRRDDGVLQAAVGETTKRQHKCEGAQQAQGARERGKRVFCHARRFCVRQCDTRSSRRAGRQRGVPAAAKLDD